MSTRPRGGFQFIEGSFTTVLKQIVDSRPFQWGVMGVVVFAAVLVGLETDAGLVARHGDLLHRLDQLVLALFTIEAIMKMAAHGRRPWHYFRDPWNVFDFTILVICLLPVQSHYAAALRLARVLRALRLVSVFPRMQILVSSLLRCLPSMGWIGLLLFILFYVYAVTGVFLWRGNDPVHFGDLPTAFLTLFRVVTLEDWTDIMYTQMFGSHRHPFELQVAVATNPRGAPILAPIYFVSFVLLGTMIFLNLFIGVVLTSMDEAQKDHLAAELRRQRSKPRPPRLVDEVAEVDRKLEDVRTLLDQIRRRLGE